MKKLFDLKELNSEIKLVCWDLDGTLFDTETMWYNMDKLVLEKYGDKLSKEEAAKASENIAANAYKTFGYRANAEKALNYFKKNNIYQVLINRCDLTNKTMFNNEMVNKTFAFNEFDGIISEKLFIDKFTNQDMYNKAVDMFETIKRSEVIAICDMPFELKAAKDSGLIPVWSKNKDYPFTKEELQEIEKLANYYVEDFSDLIK